MMRLTLSLLMNNVCATSRAAVTSPQLTTTYSRSTPLCQASKQPEITAINSLDVAALTSHREAAITPASLGSFSMARPPERERGSGEGQVKVACKLWLMLLMAVVPTTGNWNKSVLRGGNQDSAVSAKKIFFWCQVFPLWLFCHPSPTDCFLFRFSVLHLSTAGKPNLHQFLSRDVVSLAKTKAKLTHCLEQQIQQHLNKCCILHCCVTSTGESNWHILIGKRCLELYYWGTLQVFGNLLVCSDTWSVKIDINFIFVNSVERLVHDLFGLTKRRLEGGETVSFQERKPTPSSRSNTEREISSFTCKTVLWLHALLLYQGQFSTEARGCYYQWMESARFILRCLIWESLKQNCL